MGTVFPMEQARITVDGPALRDDRMRKGMELADVARAAGITASYLSRVELHSLSVRPRTYRAIRRAVYGSADESPQQGGDMTATSEFAAAPAQIERYLTAAEYAELEEVSLKTIYNGVRLKGWPHHRIGRQIKFSAAQIEEIRAMQRFDADPARRPPRRKRRPRAA